MIDFENLNKIAHERKKELDSAQEREKKKQQETADREKTAFINYLIEYLAPYVEQTAKEAIKDNGKKTEKCVHVNDIIFGYKKTPYIIEKYKVKYAEETISIFMKHVIEEVENEYKNRLSAFWIKFLCGRNSGFIRDDYYIRIIMQLK